jgi:hypothetical protein
MPLSGDFHQKMNHSFGVIRTPSGAWHGVAVGSRDRPRTWIETRRPGLPEMGGLTKLIYAFALPF